MEMMSSISSYGSSSPQDLGKVSKAEVGTDASGTSVRNDVGYPRERPAPEVELSEEGLAKSSGDAAAAVGSSAQAEETEQLAKNGLSPKEQAEKENEEREKELAEAAREEAKALMQSLNKQNIDLSFSVDKDLGDTVVSVTDKATEDLIRQIPSEEFLEMSKRLREYTETNSATSDEKKDALKGLLLDAQV
ncbi:MAG: flagellar protein FlaG [Succinivibrio sp.]|nr:flagellar protein FlaG [Succinivibrio sp.]